MWAQYYAQYAAYSQQTATPSTTSVASGTTTNGTSTSSQQDGEAIYKQWIDYYKACNMTKEAEDMEKKLKEYINAKNVCFCYFILFNFKTIILFVYRRSNKMKVKVRMARRTKDNFVIC